MSDTVITVDSLSKAYKIGLREQQHGKTFREAFTDTLLSPLRRLKSIAAGGNGASNAEDTFWALKDVSFEVKRGEVVGIIGRNGAGKSTLLKILSRITEPTSGEVRLRGRVASLLEVGTGFHPELTGRENIYLNGAILGMKRAEIARKFDEIVAFAEVEKFLDTPVKRYSSGMYVRLAFAVAAHLEPEILIVDEVLAVGDGEFQKKCLGKMKDVAAGEGRTVLFVSHNMAAVQQLCSVAMVLRGGESAFLGKTPQAIEYYASSTARTVQTNLRETQERVGKGAVRFTALRFEDDAGDEVSEAETGQPLNVIVSYESSKYQPLRGSRVSFTINSSLGDALMNFSSEITNPELTTLPPNGVIRCRIARLPITASTFGVSLFLLANGEIQDWIEGAAQLHVRDGDFFGTGKLYPDGWQGKGVLVDHAFHLVGKATALEVKGEVLGA